MSLTYFSSGASPSSNAWLAAPRLLLPRVDMGTHTWRPPTAVAGTRVKQLVHVLVFLVATSLICTAISLLGGGIQTKQSRNIRGHSNSDSSSDDNSSVSPITVSSLNYTFPLCPWVATDPTTRYPRERKATPPHIRACLDRLLGWVREGRLVFSPDVGMLLDAVAAGGVTVATDDMDMWFVSEAGLAKDSYAHCPDTSIGDHGMTWLPQRTIVGGEAYRRAYVKYADRVCTCEFDGPFLCIRSALDDEPTLTTVGYGPGTMNYGGATWSTRTQESVPTALDDDRGSAFWSIKYKFGSAWWLTPSHGGKDMANNRIPFFGVPEAGLYKFPNWVDETLQWCTDLRGMEQSSVTMPGLLQYVRGSVEREVLNGDWVRETMTGRPCVFVNTVAMMENACGHLAKVKASRGDRTREASVYESFHVPVLHSLRDAAAQRVCAAVTGAERINMSFAPPSKKIFPPLSPPPLPI